MYFRWGEGEDLDFWTALARGEVETPELRAMDLLESVCDAERFGYYCQTAVMPARGNLTGIIYLIRKQGGVVELSEDMRPVGDWCISVGPHVNIPGTDNVVILKAMIEGEEMEFRRIGNRNRFYGVAMPASTGVVDPYCAEWLPKEWRRKRGDLSTETYLPDLLKIPDVIERAEDRQMAKCEELLSRAIERNERDHSISLDWIHPRRWKDILGEMTPKPQVRDNPAEDLYSAANFEDDLRRMDIEDALRIRIREAVAQELDQEGPVSHDACRVRLGDGEWLSWMVDDDGRCRDLGINIGAEVLRMNNEGQSREQIEWLLENVLNVRVTDTPGLFVPEVPTYWDGRQVNTEAPDWQMAG